MQTIPPSPGQARPSTLSVLRMTVAESGVRSLYTGLSASLLRQMSYSLVRLGSYEEMKARLSRDSTPSSGTLLLAAMAAGGLGGVAGNPAGACVGASSRAICIYGVAGSRRHPPRAHDQRLHTAPGEAVQLLKCDQWARTAGAA